MPVTPVIAHVPAADGAIAPLGPVTVAVKVIDDPSAAVGAFATTLTVGVVFTDCGCTSRCRSSC